MVELGSRRTTERVRVGNSPPTAARTVFLPDDKLHLRHPSFGSRMLTRTLKREGLEVNRKRVQRLMRLMALESTAPKPNTSKPAPEHPVYPYLLRNLKVSGVNQVWASDITYIPMARGFVFLVAIIDLYSRLVLAWRLSNSISKRIRFNNALGRLPEDALNASQYTAPEWPAT